MFILDDQLVSEEIFEKQFVCNLSKCKGACCIAGDAGAPLLAEEVTTLEKEYDNFKNYLTAEGRESIEKEGYATYDAEDKNMKTTLIDGGPCAYIQYDKNDVTQCGIEQAFLAGKTTFQKPISCHLYPIRVTGVGSLEALNYDEWEICDDACSLGKELQVPVFRFLKNALTRAYGADFYNKLEDYYKSIMK